MVKTLWHFAETHGYPVTQVLPSRGSQQEENRQVFPALNSILVGKRDHTQANEEAQVPVWPSLALWPPGDLGSRAQGMMRACGWWWALLFFLGSGAALSREEKRGLLPHLSSSSFTFHGGSFQIQQALGVAISFWGCFEFPSFLRLDKDLSAQFGEVASRYLRQTPAALTTNTCPCEPQANLCWWACYHFTDQSTWRQSQLGNCKWVATTSSDGACLLCSLRPPS